MKRGHREEIIPSAARLLTSLRDLGYDFVNAVADIIDNSIAAEAGRVDVTIQFDGADSWVRIADDGTGMSGIEISEAMRLGSHRDYGEDELGKFGLGLKTASLSQARSITVASRTSHERRQIECRQLDLDDVEERDRWEILHPYAEDRPAEAVKPLLDGTGTVVVWHKLDRVLNRRDPFGSWAERHLLALADRLDLHLGMVFGRFLSGEARRHQELAITINGTSVEPWDPFCTTEHTEHLPETELPVAGSVVRYRPFVLPPQREFSDDETWRRASGPLQWNRQQGFYIYRADRMIQSGGWSWMRSQDEHTKLARAGLEFWPDLDEAFEINISKMRVKLPEELREQLKPLVSFLTRRADDRYRAGNRGRQARARPRGMPQGGAVPTPLSRTFAPSTSVPTTSRPVAGGSPPSNITVDGGSLGTEGSTGQPSTLIKTSVGQALEQAAERAGLTDALAEIRAELAKGDPEAARELGW